MKIGKLHPDYLRNIIFGAEDSLVSTVGVMFGVASAGATTQLVLTTGFVVIAVEALSMGAGAFLSEETTNEAEHTQRQSNPTVSGLLMFLSYFIAGFLPLIPYALLDLYPAKFASVGLALIALFTLGYAPTKKFKSALRMVLVAGIAVLVGFAIGEFFGHVAI